MSIKYICGLICIKRPFGMIRVTFAKIIPFCLSILVTYDFRANSSLHTKKLYDTNQCEGWNCGNIARANSLVKERCRERVRSNASPSLASWRRAAVGMWFCPMCGPSNFRPTWGDPPVLLPWKEIMLTSEGFKTSHHTKYRPTRSTSKNKISSREVYSL